MLRRGNRYPNTFVMNLQLCLIQGGHLECAPSVDGYSGRETKADLAELQKEHDHIYAGKPVI